MSSEERFIQWLKIAFGVLMLGGGAYALYLLNIIAHQ